MRNAKVRLVLAGAAVLACGAPLYLLLDRLHLLSPALRETPWPLAIPAAAALVAVATVRRKPGAVVAASAAASLVLLAAAGAVARRSLPPAAREAAVGAKLPALVLSDENGRKFDLGALHGKPAVVLLYRGAWCPSCRKQVIALAKAADRFLAAGVDVYAISPDPPNVSRKWSLTISAPFPLLSDDSSRLANELCDGDSHCQLIVDAHGTIRWASFNDNWRVLAPPDAVLQAAWRLR